jgi:hypothetical protein
MDDVLTIPHRRALGMCPVNGIRDLVQWRAGRDWSNEFLYGLGQGGGFAYLRFKSADPPRQVYWGIAGPRQHEYLAGLLGADYAVVENRTFRFSWNKAREAVDAETPPVIGPLDMFHLHFYPEIYRQRHIPIHYLLLVGYDEAAAYVHDTDRVDVQAVPLDELQAAWDVNVPGMGKRNRLAVLSIPQDLPPTATLIRKSIVDQCQMMLHPPVSLVGIPAMEKLAREIAGWPEELGEEVATRCLRQVREFLNSPPDLEGDHLTAGRDLCVAFLQEAGPMAGVDLADAIGQLEATIGIIPQLAKAVAENRLEDAAALIRRIAGGEMEVYQELSRIIPATEDETPR